MIINNKISTPKLCMLYYICQIIMHLAVDVLPPDLGMVVISNDKGITIG